MYDNKRILYIHTCWSESIHLNSRATAPGVPVRAATGERAPPTWISSGHERVCSGYQPWPDGDGDLTGFLMGFPHWKW